MARPQKDRTGITPEWGMTTLRVPRWLAVQIGDLAKKEGFEQAWEVLLRRPRFVIPNPLPARYQRHGPAIGTGPILVLREDPDEVVRELKAMGLEVERVEEFGIQPARAAHRRLRTAESVAAARKDNLMLLESVDEAIRRIRARRHLK